MGICNITANNALVSQLHRPAFRSQLGGCQISIKYICSSLIADEDLLSMPVSKVTFGRELVDGLRWVEIDFPGDIRSARRVAGTERKRN